MNRAVDRNQWPSTFDRDIDLQPARASDPTEPIDSYRQLVANPLLAVASAVGAIVLIRMSLQSRNLPLFLASIALLFASILLIQFHCLDCGAMGWGVAANRHACPPIVARWREGRPCRWRIPGLKIQLILWLYLLASVTALVLILFVFSR
jgi:hypothetical protein